jgi:hypothetical protein
MKSNLELVLEKAIIALLALQNKNGSWPGASDTDATHNSPIQRQTPFITSLVCLALSNTKDYRLQNASRRAARWLHSQLSPDGTLSYWGRHRQSTLPHYPDDLDDTAAALHAIELHLQDSIEKRARRLASFTRQLLNLEVSPAGPYRTWLVPKNTTVDTKWLDTDVAVNAQLAWFLHSLDITLEPLLHYIEEHLQEPSPYYTSLFPQFWYAAHITQIPQSTFNTLPKPTYSTDAWLSLSLQLLRNHTLDTQQLESALSSQQNDGSFPASGFIIEEQAPNGEQYLGGSAAFTTALAVSVLQQLVHQDHMSINHINHEHATAITSFLHWHNSLPATVQKQDQKLVSTLTKGTHAVTVTALAEAARAAIWISDPPATQTHHLALGSLYGWYAYTLFDHAYDDGRVTTLPTALVAHRKMLSSFADALPYDEQWQVYVESILTKMDTVNQWELINRQRQKPAPWTLTNLGVRALGHALPLFATYWVYLRENNGNPSEDSRLESLYRYAVHALTAKQLCDDAHDWKEDRDQNIYTPVTHWQHQQERKNPTIPSEHVFWHHTIMITAKAIQRQLTLAHKELITVGLHAPEKLSLLTDASKATVASIIQRSKETKIFTETLRK